MIRVIDWPTISAALQPKIRSAASFHEFTRPSSDLPTMASSDEETIAASRAAARSAGSPGASSISSSTPATRPSASVSRAGRATKAARPPSGRSATSSTGSAARPSAKVRATGLAAGSSGSPSAASSRQAPLQRAAPGAGLRPQRAAAAALCRTTRPSASVAKAATGRPSIRASSAVMILRTPARAPGAACERPWHPKVPASRSARGTAATMAEREGFEPSRRFPAYTLSRRAPSTTRPPLRSRPDKPCPAPLRKTAETRPPGRSVNDLGVFSLIAGRVPADGLSSAAAATTHCAAARAKRNEKVDRPSGQDARGTR